MLPASGWERRHSPASFTYAAHQAFFAGFLPTPASPGPHPRLFAAIDYSSYADGEVILWEANPYFDVPGRKRRSLRAQRIYEERSRYLVAAMTDFFSRLLAAPEMGAVRSTR